MGFDMFSMSLPSPRLLVSLTLFAMTEALPWAFPSPTFSYKPSDVNPLPTQSPILPRDSTYPSNVCGWVDGHGDSPILCPTDQSCVWDTVNSVVGCCPSGGCSSIVTGCVDSRAIVHNGFNPDIMTCAGSAQCYHNVYPGGYIQYNCGSATWASNVQTTFVNQPADVKLGISMTAMNPPISATSAISNSNPATLSTSNSPAATASPSSSGVPQSTSSVPSDTSQISAVATLVSSMAGKTSTSTTASSSSISSESSAINAFEGDATTLASIMRNEMSKTGVIIGGVLGGAAISLILAALCWWILHRRRHNRARPSFDANKKDYYGDGTNMSVTSVDRNEPFRQFSDGIPTTSVNQADPNNPGTEALYRSYLPSSTPPTEQHSYPLSPDDVVSPISSTRYATDGGSALQSAVPSPYQLSSRLSPQPDPELIKSELSLIPPPDIPRKSSKRAPRRAPAGDLLWNTVAPPVPTREISAASSRYSQDSGIGRTARAAESPAYESSKTNIIVPRPTTAPSKQDPERLTGFGLSVGVPRPSRAHLRDIDALAAMALRIPSPARLPSYKPRRVDGMPIVRVPVPKTREERANSGGITYVPNI